MLHLEPSFEVQMSKRDASRPAHFGRVPWRPVTRAGVLSRARENCR
jgi:hypothetical protein